MKTLPPRLEFGTFRFLDEQLDYEVASRIFFISCYKAYRCLSKAIVSKFRQNAIQCCEPEWVTRMIF
jgi:hypothetical protein